MRKRREMMNKIETEVSLLNLAEAEAFLSVTIHRNASGEVVPTLTVIVDGAAGGFADEFNAHLRDLFDTLRKTYAKAPA